MLPPGLLTAFDVGVELPVGWNWGSTSPGAIVGEGGVLETNDLSVAGVIPVDFLYAGCRCVLPSIVCRHAAVWVMDVV